MLECFLYLVAYPWLAEAVFVRKRFRSHEDHPHHVADPVLADHLVVDHRLRHLRRRLRLRRHLEVEGSLEKEMY